MRTEVPPNECHCPCHPPSVRINRILQLMNNNNNKPDNIECQWTNWSESNTLTSTGEPSDTLCLTDAVAAYFACWFICCESICLIPTANTHTHAICISHDTRFTNVGTTHIVPSDPLFNVHYMGVAIWFVAGFFSPLFYAYFHSFFLSLTTARFLPCIVNGCSRKHGWCYFCRLTYRHVIRYHFFVLHPWFCPWSCTKPIFDLWCWHLFNP